MSKAVGSMIEMLGEAPSENRFFSFFRIGSDERRNVRFLVPADKGTAAFQHSIRVNGRFVGTFSCTKEPDCPGCQSADTKANYRGFMLAYVFDAEPGKRIQIVAGGQRLMRAIAMVHQAYKDVRWRDCVIKKTGTGFQTQYTVAPRASKQEVMELFASMGSKDGDAEFDPATILLSGDSRIGAQDLEPEVIKEIAAAFEVEAKTTKELFEAIEEGAVETLLRVAAPLTEEQMHSMLRGERPKYNKDGDEKESGSSEASDDDFEF